MKRNVLLIGDIKSFMVKAIQTGLEKNSFIVEVQNPDIKAIHDIVENYHVVLLYAEDKVQPDFLVYMKDRIDERDIHFFVIGNPDELDKIFGIIPETKIEASFERPFRVETVSERLEAAFNAQENMLDRKRILIVDDDPLSLNAFSTWLSGRYRVYTVNSGMNAITFLARNEVDLVLMDYEMPVTSGAQVLEMLRSEPATAHIPVMFLTGKKDRDTVMKLISLKPEKYLLKSLSPKELLDQIGEYFYSKA